MTIPASIVYQFLIAIFVAGLIPLGVVLVNMRLSAGKMEEWRAAMALAAQTAHNTQEQVNTEFRSRLDHLETGLNAARQDVSWIRGNMEGKAAKI